MINVAGDLCLTVAKDLLDKYAANELTETYSALGSFIAPSCDEEMVCFSDTFIHT